MIVNIKNVVRSKDLISGWTDRIIRTRYQQSVLGGLWMIVQPIANVAIFSLIFTYFVPIKTDNIPYVIFSYIAVTPWMLFANSLSDMANALVDNMNLVTKIYFPREILPIAALLARLVDFFIASIILIFIIIYYQVPVLSFNLFYLPIVLIIQLSFSLGLGLILAASNVFYRDIRPLLALVIQIWFYASPIIYPVSLVPENYRSLYLLNPMSAVLEAYRAILLNQTAPSYYLIYAGLIAAFTLVIGYWFFKRVEFQVADSV
jgi:lipopolysaccharide transport system permease protein